MCVTHSHTLTRIHDNHFQRQKIKWWRNSQNRRKRNWRKKHCLLMSAANWTTSKTHKKSMAANVRNKCQWQSKQQQQQQQLATTTNENEKTIFRDVFARGHTLFYSILMCVVKLAKAKEEAATSSGAGSLHMCLAGCSGLGSLGVVLANWSLSIQIENPP